MQSPAAVQPSHLHSRSPCSRALITDTPSSSPSSPLSSTFSSSPLSTTSTLHSAYNTSHLFKLRPFLSKAIPKESSSQQSTSHEVNLSEYTASNPSQHIQRAGIKQTSSIPPPSLQGREVSPLSQPSQGGPPHKSRKRSSSHPSSLDRRRDIYKHWTTKSFKPSLAINLQTNPDQTTSLWQLVMTGGARSGQPTGGSNQGRKKDSKSSLAGEGKKGSKKEGSKKSVSGQSYPSTESDTPVTSTTKTAKTSASNAKSETPSNVSSKRNTPRSKAFGQNVLESRSIIINQDSIPVTAYAHFVVKEPPPPEMTQHTYYTDVRSVPKSTIWVETDTAFIVSVQENYREMVDWRMCEAEFATYAKEELLKRNKSLDKHSRFFQTMRLVELVNKPEPETTNWVSPPLTEAPSPANRYAFDIRPDCAYWVSLQGTNKKLRYMIEAIIHTIHGNFASPYFTIEFKKDDQDWKAALNQLAGVSAVALYNRFCLRQKRFAQEETWTKRRTRVLRHYGLAMRGDQYTVWCTRPTLTEDFEWAGCEMERIGSGRCSRDDDIHELIYWINEIHCWGLTKHAPRVEKDLKWKIEQHQKEKGGSRSSDIGRDSEDERDTEDEMV